MARYFAIMENHVKANLSEFLVSYTPHTSPFSRWTSQESLGFVSAHLCPGIPVEAISDDPLSDCGTWCEHYICRRHVAAAGICTLRFKPQFHEASTRIFFLLHWISKFHFLASLLCAAQWFGILLDAASKQRNRTERETKPQKTTPKCYQQKKLIN